ncbi:MAG: integrase arm-type DNA-binding domain-containing protein [Clostridiales Family XIII bacterium]|jgi:integrase|nr:integrase arm-type DNA-binding domain-containing protein [Clostridiales Family XIII bacterium]
MRFKLTRKIIDNLASLDKPYNVSDGAGLILHVSKKGTKVWRYIYRYEKKQQTLTIGSYPNISIKEARQIHAEAKKALAHGIDPKNKNNTFTNFEKISEEHFISFKDLSSQYIEEHSKFVSAKTIYAQNCILKKYIFPDLGSKNAFSITSSDISRSLSKIQSKGFDISAKKALGIVGQIFRFGIGKGYGDFGLKDLTIGLKVHVPRTKGYAFLSDPDKVAKLLQDIDKYKIKSPVIGTALKLMPLLFLRPSELVKGQWDEINFDTQTWVIPADRMKTKIDHIVPLSTQALDILKNQRDFTGNNKYIFPSMRKTDDHINSHSLTLALRYMGYPSDVMTIHGFRKIASTYLNEFGFNRDWIERQLSHVDSTTIRGIYNKAQFLSGRRIMMQKWADYLSELRDDKI